MFAARSFALTVLSSLILACFDTATGLPTRRQGVSPLSQDQISAFSPYTYYAAAAYCEPSTTLTWTCGTNCQSNPSFQPVASGGDGGVTQFWYVGYDIALQSVIVGHQGTDVDKVLPVLEDIDIIQDFLNPTLFPGVSSSVKVHQGFRDAHAKSASAVLAAVNTTLAKYSANHVTVVGHSLGGAIGLLSSFYLSLHLPASTTFKTVLYGMPRVGNEAFATLIDTHPSLSLSRITNRRDPVPILPGRFLGFHHPSGEVHIDDPSESWIACSGQDNTSDECEIGDTPNIFESDADDHTGPYDEITIGC
ncbi:lipase [Irpex lacteus]|nr:lipase [Irpex lacteus]